MSLAVELKPQLWCDACRQMHSAYYIDVDATGKNRITRAKCKYHAIAMRLSKDGPYYPATDVEPLWCDLCHTAHTNYSYSAKDFIDDKLSIVRICDLHKTPMRSFADNCEPSSDNTPPVAKILRAAADTHEQRNKLWGNYKRVGDAMAALMPNGVKLETSDDWNRFLIFGHVINKVVRYSQTINDGGNKDSAHDLIVYSAMLEELTQELKTKTGE